MHVGEDVRAFVILCFFVCMMLCAYICELEPINTGMSACWP